MRDVWAVAHGDRSTEKHLILTPQAQTTQAALCGREPGHAWEVIDSECDPARREQLAALPRCTWCVVLCG